MITGVNDHRGVKGTLKVAVAFFGVPRNSAVCFPSIQAQILGRLPADAQVQCYYHLYQLERVHNPRSGESNELAQQNYQPFESMIGLVEQTDGVLERWSFERIKASGDTWGDTFASMRNLILQLNSLHTVTRLLAPFDPDFVIFVRPDIEYHDPLPSYIFEHSEMRRENVYIPDWQWWGGVNDRFAVCGSESYKAYGERIEQIFPFCETTGRKLHSERLLKFALQRAGTKVHTMPTTGSRVRVNGAYANEVFSTRCCMGKRENRFFHLLARLRTWFDARK